MLIAAMVALATPAWAQARAPMAEDAWIMAPPSGVSEAAAYMTIRNARGDSLLSVACDCAARTELHDMSVENGVMRMRPLRYGVAAAPTGVIRFAPSGKHIMLVGLVSPLQEGEQVMLRLTFRNAGVVTVSASVRRR